MQEQQRKDLLESAVRDVVESQHGTAPRQRDSAARSNPRQRTLILVMLLVWSMIGWIWATRPAFLFGEGTTAMAEPAHAEASLRFAMFLERGRVDAYVRRHGRLPTNLAEAGATEDGVSLVPTSDGYELTGRRSGISLRLNSRMDADSFLGGSLSQLQRGN